jgi:hypothetical protein
MKVTYYLNRAIQASLELYQETVGECSRDDANSRVVIDETNDSLNKAAEELRLVLRLSEQQQIEEEQRRLLEEETFRQVLELSLTDK